MSRKTPSLERKLILARDHRRKYGARLKFQVERAAHIGELESVSLLLPDGSLATIQPDEAFDFEVQGGKSYEISVEGFPTASDAESAGMQLAQALLLCAVSLDFGLRLSYQSHIPPTVFDRTISSGLAVYASGYTSWPQDVVLSELWRAIQTPLGDRRSLLSVELFASAALESNERARFVMAVSALEPLAIQESLGAQVASGIDALVIEFDADVNIPSHLRSSLKGRLLQLKRESVRQALKRHCDHWFPGDQDAWKSLDYAYALRSELLHDGRPSDLDILLAEQTRAVTSYLRVIYQKEFGLTFRAPVALGGLGDSRASKELLSVK
jgi:hypothetical protein